MNTIIDLRSDTFTQPTPAMRDAMAAAQTGDDVYGEDPTVNALEEWAAATLGFEAAIFASSGTQTNLLALLSHCQRGDEYIVGHDAHTYKYEGGGAAVLGSIQPQPIVMDERGCLPLEAVRNAIKPDDPHFACSRVLALENTQHGRVLPLSYLQQARDLCDETGLILHLDGARAFNAAVAANVPVQDILQHFDSVSICLSKGLGAPVGSLLLGSRATISRARRHRKMLGGGMRQAGILAAAGRMALEEGPALLAADHRRAADIATALTDCPKVQLRQGWQQSNMVWLDFAEECGEALRQYCAERHVLVGPQRNSLRLVLHRDIDDQQAEYAAQVLRGFFT